MYLQDVVIVVSTAAGTAKEVGFAASEGERWRVKKIRINAGATTAAHASDYASLRAYVGTTAITAARTTQTALTVRTPEGMALTGGLGDCEITDSSPFNLRVTHGGTGAAVDFTVTVKYERLNVAV